MSAGISDWFYVSGPQMAGCAYSCGDDALGACREAFRFRAGEVVLSARCFKPHKGESERVVIATFTCPEDVDRFVALSAYDAAI